MAVRKLKGSWWVDLTYGSERLRKRSPSNTRAGAEAYEAHLRREVAVHGSVSRLLETLDPGPTKRPLLFREYAEEWLATYVRTNNRASEQRTKAGVIHQHLAPHFGDLPLAEIQRREIELYKAAKLDAGLGAKTINNHLTILGKCLRTAQEDNLLPVVPLIKWLRKKPAEFDFLMPIESHQLLGDRTEPMWTDLARLALRTGMRRGELMALEWSSVDIARARLTVRASLVEGVLESPKSNAIRHLPLTEDVVAMLAARTHREGLVFRAPDGAPLTKGKMASGLERLCRRTGVRPIGWHVLRHTFASQLAMQGVPLLTIKELMGHSTIQMTMRYAHLAPSTLAQAVPLLLQAEAQAVEDFRQPVVNRSPFSAAPALQVPSFQV